MKLNSMLLASLAYFGGTTLAIAADHDVVMERRGMYPHKVYVQVGDTITFTNRSDKTMQLRSYYYDPNDYQTEEDVDPVFAVLGTPYVADDENPDLALHGVGTNEDGECFNEADPGTVPWVSNTLSEGASVTIRVSACMNLKLRSPYVSGYSSFNSYHSYIIIGQAPTG